MAEAAVSAGTTDAASRSRATVTFDERTFEIRDSAINVEDLMARIRGSIEEKKESRIYRQDALLAQGVGLLRPGESNKNLRDHLGLLKHLAPLDLEGDPIVSHRALTGRAIRWAKKLTRFWVRKYTDGLFARQSHFNAELVEALAELNRQIEEQKAENQRLREQLDALARR